MRRLRRQRNTPPTLGGMDIARQPAFTIGHTAKLRYYIEDQLLGYGAWCKAFLTRSSNSSFLIGFLR